MYACLLACLYPSDFARELEVKCSRGQVRITADSKSRREALFPGLDLDSGLDWTLDWTQIMAQF